MRSHPRTATRGALLGVTLIGSTLLCAASLAAQQPQTSSGAARSARVQATMQATTTPNRDVILEVPELAVDSIGLTVSNLRAHVALDANAMNLVQVTAGVDVGIKQVQLGVVGVLGEAYLYVDLDNVARVVARVVQTLDRNPEILTQVLRTVDTTVTSIATPLNRAIGGAGAAPPTPEPRPQPSPPSSGAATPARGTRP